MAQIYAINPDGSGRIQITSSGVANYHPALNADRSQLAYSSVRPALNVNLSNNLYLANIDGGNERLLVSGGSFNDPSQYNYFDPTFTPSGSQVAATYEAFSHYGYYNGISLLNLDGTQGGAPFHGQPGIFSQPSYSASGKIAVVYHPNNGIFTPYVKADILIANSDGSGAINVSNDPNAASEESHPALSPDGSRVAFVSNRDGNNEIYIANSDGTGLKRLTNNTADDTEPCFSPDGTKIVFASDRDPYLTGIYVMNTDGSNPTRLAFTNRTNCHPCWR